MGLNGQFGELFDTELHFFAPSLNRELTNQTNKVLLLLFLHQKAGVRKQNIHSWLQMKASLRAFVQPRASVGPQVPVGQRRSQTRGGGDGRGGGGLEEAVWAHLGKQWQ